MHLWVCVVCGVKWNSTWCFTTLPSYNFTQWMISIIVSVCLWRHPDIVLNRLDLLNLPKTDSTSHYTKPQAGRWAVRHKQGWVAQLVPNQYCSIDVIIIKNFNKFINLIYIINSFFYTECFQAGECKGSIFITGEQKSDEFECLDFCKSGSFVDISNLSLANFT
jgi:hypothetical protein